MNKNSLYPKPKLGVKKLPGFVSYLTRLGVIQVCTKNSRSRNRTQSSSKIDIVILRLDEDCTLKAFAPFGRNAALFNGTDKSVKKKLLRS